MKNKVTVNEMYKDAPDNLKGHIFYGMTLDPEQEAFRDAIWDYQNIITICNARAGVGKTCIALATANLLVQYGRYNEIVYIVSPTQAQKQGYLPGGTEEKTAKKIIEFIDKKNFVDKQGFGSAEVWFNELKKLIES